MMNPAERKHLIALHDELQAMRLFTRDVIKAVTDHSTPNTHGLDGRAHEFYTTIRHACTVLPEPEATPNPILSQAS